MKRLFLSLILTSFIMSTLLNAQKAESLKLDWSGHKGWKEIYQDNQGNVSVVEYVHKDEDLTNWTEMLVVQTIGVESTNGVSLEVLMNRGFSEAQKNAPKAKLTLIEKNETIEYPWIEYKVEVPEYLNDPNPESQLFRVIKGEKAVFLIWWATRKDEISKSEISDWHIFFEGIEIE